MYRSIVVAILAAVVSCGAYAAKKQVKPDYDVPVIEIKGIRLGMTSDDALQIFGGTELNSTFTIGEVGTESGIRPLTTYIDGKLSTFFFSFDSTNFDRVLSAVLSKYPMTKCSNSAVQNRMGASFTQIECVLSSKDGIMTLRKYGKSINSGNLFLASNEVLELRKQDAAKKSGDI